MSNFSDNNQAWKDFDAKLKKLNKETASIHYRVLTRAVNEGLTFSKMNTPVVTGWLRKSWYALPTSTKGDSVEKRLMNNASYSLYWNNGHRVVRNGVTVGFYVGSHLTDKVTLYVQKRVQKLLAEEISKLGRI